MASPGGEEHHSCQPVIFSSNVFLARADAALAPHLPSGGGAPVPASLAESDSADGPSSFVCGAFDSPIQLRKSLFSFVLGKLKKNTLPRADLSSLKRHL